MNINKTTLQKALEIVKPGLSNKEIIEQSTSFAFIKGRVVTYNDEISISHPVEGLEIEGVIKADKLYPFLTKLKKDELELSIEGNEVVIKSGRSKASLALESEIKLPLIDGMTSLKWKPLPEEFLKLVSFVLPACSRDMSKPVLTCVHISKEGVIEASDSFRIARSESGSTLPVNEFLLPATSAINMVKLKPTKIAEGKGWIHFKTEAGTVISCRTFEDSFPDTKPYVEVEGVELTFPKTIIEIIDRAQVFAKQEFVLDESVTITIEKNKFKIKSEAEGGRYEETVNTTYDGDTIEFIISPYLLRGILTETLDCIASDTKLRFEGSNWVYITCLKNKN